MLQKNDIRILSLADRQDWITEHSENGLPSQSWIYARALSSRDVNPKLAIVRSGGARMLMPFFEREWRGCTDISTTVGLSGASVVPVSSAPLSLWKEFAISQGWVAGYIQLSPDTDLEAIDQSDEVCHHNSVFMLDLRGGDPIGRASAIIRRKIRRAERVGATLVDDRRLLASSLQRLFPATMERVGARHTDMFSPHALEQWAHDPASIVVGAEFNGIIEAVSLVLVAGREAEDFITACSERYRWLHPWLLSNAINRLQQMGVARLNLGGGIQAGDSLSEFKARFNGIPTALRGMRQIYDSQKYNELCLAAGTPLRARWFPAYRLAEARQV